MPLNNENSNGLFFVKNSNGNWVPLCAVTEIKLASEISPSEAWAISVGGLEIVKRGD